LLTCMGSIPTYDVIRNNLFTALPNVQWTYSCPLDPMDKSNVHWTYLCPLDPYACPLDPMDKSNVHWTFQYVHWTSCRGIGPPKCCRSVPLVTDGLEIHDRKI
ncbi:Hypothetical predicted protein, partial [Paramuricea clavata]